MKFKKILLFLFSIVIIYSSNFNSGKFAYADTTEVYLGGMPAGFSVYSDSAFVAGICDVISINGIYSPAKEADIRVGDKILSIDNIPVNCASDIESVVKDGNKKILIIKRLEDKIIKEITPIKDVNNKYRLGVFIKDTICGIGTVTFINNGRFASLGHPVLDDAGMIMGISGGEIFPCSITGVSRGEKGIPGELKGVFLRKKSIGNINKNQINGVYGDYYDINNSSFIKKIKLGNAKVGNATIYTTINGTTPKEYEISIIKVDSQPKECKNYVIKITDEELLKETGGIVQGMSGSPIVQDGKLVGAVTHVFINDPTRGFGIDIQNMINNW